ncbi:hypothetical protein KFF05_07045 [bacterium SCSIO 12827]|nr:hypothetical protein KFF05_07045 [bacterium SCSIO 12827]
MPTLKISKKVPLAIVIASVLATVVTGALSYRKAAIELQGEAEKKLTALGGAKTQFINSYLDSIRQDLKVQSDSPLIRRALGDSPAHGTSLATKRAPNSRSAISPTIQTPSATSICSTSHRTGQAMPPPIKRITPGCANS